MENFSFGKKWFWIGIIIAILNTVAGIIFGIALALENERKNEGLVIIGLAIGWALIGYFILFPWFVQSGMMPKMQFIR